MISGLALFVITGLDPVATLDRIGDVLGLLGLISSEFVGCNLDVVLASIVLAVSNTSLDSDCSGTLASLSG